MTVQYRTELVVVSEGDPERWDLGMLATSVASGGARIVHRRTTAERLAGEAELTDLLGSAMPAMAGLIGAHASGHSPEDNGALPAGPGRGTTTTAAGPEPADVPHVPARTYKNVRFHVAAGSDVVLNGRLYVGPCDVEPDRAGVVLTIAGRPLADAAGPESADSAPSPEDKR